MGRPRLHRNVRWVVVGPRRPWHIVRHSSVFVVVVVLARMAYSLPVVFILFHFVAFVRVICFPAFLVAVHTSLVADDEESHKQGVMRYSYSTKTGLALPAVVRLLFILAAHGTNSCSSHSVPRLANKSHFCCCFLGFAMTNYDEQQHQLVTTFSSRTTSRNRIAGVLHLIDVDAVTNAVSVDQIPKTTMGSSVSIAPTPPAVEPKVEIALEMPASVVSEPKPAFVEVIASPPIAVAPPPLALAPMDSIALPAMDDLPLPAIGVGVLAAFAAVTFAMRGSVDEREMSSSSSSSSPPMDATAMQPPAPEAAAVVAADLSIPYDAAARLAYEQTNKSMNYETFRKKYETDAIADVKAKRKQTA